MKHKMRICKSDKIILTVTEISLEKVSLRLAVLRQLNARKVSLYNNITVINKLEYSQATVTYCKSLHEL